MATLLFLLFGVPALASALPTDSIAPSRVEDLALQDFVPDSVGSRHGARFVLKWTAPGDDAGTGNAWRYEMRIACGDLDEARWPDAIPLTDFLDLPAPKSAGARESRPLTVGGLDPDTDYSIGLKAVDEAGHYGPLSNVVTFHTLGSSRDFSELVFLNGLDVWVWGHHIEGDSLVARYARCEFSLGGYPRPLSSLSMPPRADGDSREQNLPKIPYMQELMDRGICFSEAKRAYYREHERLWKEAAMLMNADGKPAAQTFLERSPLVDSVSVGDRSIAVKFVGENRWMHLLVNSEVPPGSRALPDMERAIVAIDGLTLGALKAKALVAQISSDASLGAKRESVLYITRGGGTMFAGGGSDAANMKAQLAWLLDKHTSEGMPEGPLGEPIVSEILEANPRR
jgi:hypothetical protein